MNDHLEPTDNAPQQGSTPAPVPAVSEAPSSQPVLANADAPPVRVVVRNGGGAARRPAKRPMAQPRPANGPSRAPRASGPTRPAAPKRPRQDGNASRPAHPTHHHAMLTDEADDSFIARHRAKFIVAVIALVVGGGVYFVKTSKPASTAKAPEVVKISMSMPKPPAPPPPPPPKQLPPPPKDEKMVAETQPEDKPQEAPKPVQAPPTETLGTNLKSDGAGMAGLGGVGNGGGFGGGGGHAGSKWGWYAGQVQKTVADAMHNNKKTRTANIKTIQVRIWPDPRTGRITHASLDSSTGDHALDVAIQNDVLTGLQLQEPPPTGMPAPIVLRLTARRP